MTYNPTQEEVTMYRNRSTEHVEHQLAKLRHTMRITFAAYRKSGRLEHKEALAHQLKYVDIMKQELERRA